MFADDDDAIISSDDAHSNSNPASPQQSPPPTDLKNEDRKRKRVMTPAVSGYTIPMQRKLLSEIRTRYPHKGMVICHTELLSNGEEAGAFATHYIKGQNKKRRQKPKKRRNPLP